MYRYTTPTIPISIEDLDFTLVNNFRVAIEQDDKELYLFVVNADDPIVDADENTITLKLTQEQTAKVREGFARLQIRVVFNDGTVLATDKARLTINDVIDEVIV